MSTPFVTFPGTAGNYVSTADENLLDADTAHLQQSIGTWGNGGFTTTVLSDTHKLFGDTSIKLVLDTDVASATQRFADLASGVATVEDDVRSASVWWWTDQAGLKAKVTLLWNSVVPALLGATDGTYVNLTQNDWTEVTATGTAPASTAYCGVQTDIAVVAGGNVPQGDYWCDQACIREGSDATFVRSTRIVGDLDLRAKVAPDDVTPAATQVLLDQYVAATGGYRLQLETSGAISLLAHGATGAISESSSLFTLTDGAATEIRVTMDASAGDLTWYQDNVEVDDDTYTAQALKAAGLDLYVGALSTDASHFAGNIYWLEIRDGIAGPVVARFDAADVAGQLT